MPKLKLSLAVGPYDRTRALIDGSVTIDGAELYGMTLSPEEIFFRAFRHAEFDICELSMSSFTVNTARGDCPYVGVPAFVSRAFRHNAIYVRTDRIKKPADLKGKRIGVPEYQLTANVWARLILEDDFGVKASDVTWVRGGIDHPERPEKIKIKLPADVKLENAPEGTTITQLLAEGKIDAFIAPRPPSLALKANPNIGWLFPDPVAAAQEWYKRTGIFPIMHLLGIRRELAEQHPWLPGAALKAFEQSKAAALDLMADTSASKVTLPFIDERLKEAKDLMGEDFWSYGVAPNRKTLEAFLKRHHAEGLSSRLVSVDEMFHPATYERFSI